MFEANKIRVGYAEAKGSSSSDFLAACPLVLCRGKSVHAANEFQPQNVPKVIVWNRTTSSQSSSSRNPLATGSKDDTDDSGNECVEDFCMISGNHSSTLDRLYAWERKLYDEVKASEVIRKEYEKKCDHLRHQFAKDLSAHVIDKTRAVIKDLHSRITVALQAVDSIAKRIEKMRDEELQPQLTELITAFIRMWKAMLECHHAQYITISLAYHAKTSSGTFGGETRKQIMAQLQYEFECFGLSFADWMNSLTSYVEALNSWLQSCILQPRERTRGSRRPFSPRRVVAPPIFVLCRDWSAGIKALPSEEVSDAIKNFLSDLQQLMKQQQQIEEKKETVSESNGELLQGKNEYANDEKSGNLSSIHTSLTRVLDKLTKFSEASLKLYEDIRQKNEAARVAYLNPRPLRH
ncbi:Nitrate regulatory gene2 protein [Bienertia sinuspersici]